MFEGKLIPKIDSALKNKETRCSKTRKVAFRLRRNATAKFTDRTFFSKKLVFLKKKTIAWQLKPVGLNVKFSFQMRKGPGSTHRYFLPYFNHSINFYCKKSNDQIKISYQRGSRPVGLVAWFSLRVWEVPGSTPGRALSRFDHSVFLHLSKQIFL